MSDWEDQDIDQFEQVLHIGDARRSQNVSQLLSNVDNTIQNNNAEVKKGNLIPKVEIDANVDDNNNTPVKAQLAYLKNLMKKRLIDRKNGIDDQSSPICSVKTFEQLRIPDELLKGMYSMNFQKPSKIQEKALPLLMAKPYVNCIAQSQSGTGKTASFLIASLNRIDVTHNYPQVLILSPTLELAMQTAEVARQMSKFTAIKVRNIVKGEFRPNSELVEHVLVGTPGKVLDWAIRFKSFDLNRVKVFVLDEADVMIDLQGHRQQSIKIHECLPKTCQMLLFSATYNTDVLEFAECIIENPIIITLKREEEVLDNVLQFYTDCRDEEEKYNALADMFGNILIGQTIIFVQTKKSANFLKEKLEKDGHKIALLTGDLTPDERLAVIERFRVGDERVLISTNVASRGLDIEQITLVINYDLPFDVMRKEVDHEIYLHRIGRSGRFGKPGFAVSFIDASKAVQLEQISQLSEHFMKPITLLKTSEAEQFKEWE